MAISTVFFLLGFHIPAPGRCRNPSGTICDALLLPGAVPESGGRPWEIAGVEASHPYETYGGHISILSHFEWVKWLNRSNHLESLKMSENHHFPWTKVAANALSGWCCDLFPCIS